MDVIEKPVGGQGGRVGGGAVVVALAGLDHHDVLVEGVAVLTAEPDWYCSGLQWTAAAAIQAGPTVLGLVFLHAGAASIGELHSLIGFLGSATCLSLLWEKKNILGKIITSGTVFFPIIELRSFWSECVCTY